MSHIGCGWYYASTYRAKLRRQYSLPEEPCSDGAIHFFCCSCALSQEHRELKYRGLDPSLGNQSLFSPLFSNDAIFKFKGTSNHRDCIYFQKNEKYNIQLYNFILLFKNELVYKMPYMYYEFLIKETLFALSITFGYFYLF